ncbi:hypothetical protein HaLaN_05823 [Haematococcus lacustris]|uniref:Uncharacterized protein n=1 Tax=Haematococcus lacustris TaxID=44745 RepID=A0A699YVI6_HAELA|nr:hypothetical protein HaLaN_05823 [Haematococcus lacustris]
MAPAALGKEAAVMMMTQQLAEPSKVWP